MKYIIILGVVSYISILVCVLALCKAASKGDKQLDYIDVYETFKDKEDN